MFLNVWAFSNFSCSKTWLTPWWNHRHLKKNSKLKNHVKKYRISLRLTHHTTMLRYYEKYYFHPLPPAFMHTAISRSTNYKFKFMTRNKKDEIGRRG